MENNDHKKEHIMDKTAGQDENILSSMMSLEEPRVRQIYEEDM